MRPKCAYINIIILGYILPVSPEASVKGFVHYLAQLFVFCTQSIAIKCFGDRLRVVDSVGVKFRPF